MSTKELKTIATPIEGPAEIAFTISFILLAFLWFALFIVALRGLWKNGTAGLVFGPKANAPRGFDAFTRVIGSHFATRIGRVHGLALGIIIPVFVAFGLWAAAENKQRSEGANRPAIGRY